MQGPVEMDWVHLHTSYEQTMASSESSFSSFERRPTKGNREVWHRRLGHAGLAVIDRMEDAVRGGQLNEEHNDPRHLCARCSLSKFRSVIFRRPRALREEAPLLSSPFAILHSDLICPTIPAFDQSTVYAHDFCEVTKIHGGMALQSKGQWPAVLIGRVAFLERQFQVSVKRFMTDDGPVLKSQMFQIWLVQHGRVSERSPPGNPTDNTDLQSKKQPDERWHTEGWESPQ